jgi:hypothetical protein
MSSSRAVLVVVVGLVLIVVASGALLLRSPDRALSSNGVQVQTPLITAESDGGMCQAGERVPSGTTSIRLAMASITGPRVSVKLLEGSGVATQGVRHAGWTGGSLTVPVRRLDHSLASGRLCVYLSDLNGQVEFQGEDTGPAISAKTYTGQSLEGRIRVIYLGRGQRSWLSMVPSIARRLGLGRAGGGTWISLLAAMLIVTCAALTSVLLVRELK